MARRALGAAALLAASVAGASPAEATTLPAADGTATTSVGTGLVWPGGGLAGGAASIDVPLVPSVSVGASLAGGAGGVAHWSVRALHRLVLGDQGSPSVALLAAAWGAPGLLEGWGPRPALGFALAYAPRPCLTLRLDLGYSFPSLRTATSWAFLGGAPCFGVEVAWRAREGLELTAGLTGAGEVLGLRARL